MVKLTQELANAIRFLSIDAVQNANSGHPGMPMGMADIATVLWKEFLRHSPKNPNWINRDRFILSNGHGSMLLYSLLHLTGYNVSIEDIKNFRKIRSSTSGHPEFGRIPGVETTTGPLGQGIGNAIGIALSRKILSSRFNTDRFNPIDFYTYVFCGDGCLMEGVSHEVCSFAGTYGIGNLILFWDNNGISIDGCTQGWFCEAVDKRFEAYGWYVIKDVDGHDSSSIRHAIIEAKKHSDVPVLICCDTTIGYGSINACGSHKCHGSPLGEKEIELTRKNLNWESKPFEIPEHIYEEWNHTKEGLETENQWNLLMKEYGKEHPDLFNELTRISNGISKRIDIDRILEKIESIPDIATKKIATRKTSQMCIEEIVPEIQELIGGSADLTPSVLTSCSHSENISKEDFSGNYIRYGIREFGMCAIMNGIALTGLIPYGGTFLVFSDYCKPAIRLAALMQIRSIFVFTHDSVCVGEDGPTHQPIEHLAMLRTIPNLSVWRPADIYETLVAWQYAVENRNRRPTCLILSRQELPLISNRNKIAYISRGGYIAFNCGEMPKILLIATGSEVHLAINIAKQLREKHGFDTNVISMPSVDTFERQDSEYRESVLDSRAEHSFVIELSHPDYWHRYTKGNGIVIGINQFGESGSMNDILNHFEFTERMIVEKIIDRLV